MKPGDRVVILAPSESSATDAFSRALMKPYAGYHATVIGIVKGLYVYIAIDHCVGEHALSFEGVRPLTGLDVMLELLPK